ncbi:YeeE/YedE family protein [Salibacteraceae bacterium]|nr:YeeE/YedE family protein [Salibacteraceae bacterium]
MDFIFSSWPWYVSGPLIGLMVPAMLYIGNKSFGVSSTLRSMCSMCVPLNVDLYRKNDWKNDIWNLVFLAGILIGGIVAGNFMTDGSPIVLGEATVDRLSSMGITDLSSLLPQEVFNWDDVFTLRLFIIAIVGGFFVGFGARYAGGCTSGHAIMGLSLFQLASLIAVIGFFIGGLFMTYFMLPTILSL